MIRKNFLPEKTPRVRRMRRWQKVLLFSSIGIFAAFFMFVFIGMINIDTTISLVSTFAAPETVSLDNIYTVSSGDFAVAVDGEVVAGKNVSDFEIRPTASTAKMILALAVMEKKPFEKGTVGETITISEEDYGRYVWYINNGGSNSAVEAGEAISEYDALASVLLPSSNNMADTLAVWAFGSLDNYREYASEMLFRLGIFHTTIGEDASGFSESTTSTVEDLARIGYYVLKNPVLAEIVSLKEKVVPVAGVISNTNQILGVNRIAGVKTGYIGEPSGYCLVSGYVENDRIITVARLGAETRAESFDESLAIVEAAQGKIVSQTIVSENGVVGRYESWWTGPIEIKTESELSAVTWDGMEFSSELLMGDENGELIVTISGNEYKVNARAEDYAKQPTFGEKFQHLFGWKKTSEHENENSTYGNESSEHDENMSEYDFSNDNENADTREQGGSTNSKTAKIPDFAPVTNAPTENCTKKYGYLMLINPNFKVEYDFIAARHDELISVQDTYGIPELKSSNGDNLLDAEAAAKLNEMLTAYALENPGHSMGTRSCFRARGTSCGRLCAATGESDHHTGMTCDLIDPAYGTELDTDYYENHLEWQWLRANSYKYGFIDRFPEAWAGGSMSEPLNVDENGSTGLFETWHYRYVGLTAAYEIASGKYNNGAYDSLEHYLLATGLVKDLKNAVCE